MPRQTQTYPRTLVDLLQLKDSRPFGLDDDYRGTIDLLDILGMDRITVFETSSAAVVAGSTAFQIPVDVPAQQLWVMVAASATIVADAVGDTMQARVRHRRRDRGGAYVANSEKITATLAGEQNTASIVYPRGTIMQPGDSISGIFLFDSAVGPTTGVVHLEYYRFGPESLGDAL